MFYPTEAKPQGWRAMAIFDDDRSDRLLYVGRSSTQVRSGFAEAYTDLLDEEERDHVRSISLQRWQGAPDAGRWLHQTNLTVPVKAKLARSALKLTGFSKYVVAPSSLHIILVVAPASPLMMIKGINCVELMDLNVRQSS